MQRDESGDEGLETWLQGRKDMFRRHGAYWLIVSEKALLALERQQSHIFSYYTPKLVLRLIVNEGGFCG